MARSATEAALIDSRHFWEWGQLRDLNFPLTVAIALFETQPDYVDELRRHLACLPVMSHSVVDYELRQTFSRHRRPEPPFPRPEIPPNRPNYDIEVSPHVVYKITPLALHFVGFNAAAGHELAIRRLEDFIGGLAVNEILIFGERRSNL